jgi:hypothetical protein
MTGTITPKEIETIKSDLPPEEYESRYLFDLFISDKIDHDIDRLTEGFCIAKYLNTGSQTCQ